MAVSLHHMKITFQLRLIENLLKQYCNGEVPLSKIIYAFAALKDMMKKRSRHSKWKQDVINRIAELQVTIDLFSITDNR